MPFIAPSRGVQVIRRRTETALASFPSRSFYVDATGGNDGNSGTSPADAWQTLDYVRGLTFSPGDHILLKRGETWQTSGYYGIDPSTSGTVFSPIVFGAYGSGTNPIIDCADYPSSWNDEGGNVWSAAVTWTARYVWFDGTIGNEESAQGDVNAEFDWYLNDGTDTLYIYSVGDPSTTYTAPGVAVARRQGTRVQQDYITFQDIHVQYAEWWGFYVDNASNVVHKRCTVTRNHVGFASNEAAGDTSDDCIITNCTTRYNANGGILVGRNTQRWLITANDCGYDCQANVAGEGSVKAWGAGSGNHTFEYNDVHNSVRTGGPWIDETTGGPCIVRYNQSHDNTLNGIFIEKNSDAEVYYNLCYNNGSVGLALFGTNALPVDGTLVYNNVCYGSSSFNIQAYGDGNADSFTNNLFRNNILDGAGTRELQCYDGGENDGTNGYGNVYEYNCLGAEYVGFVLWGLGNTEDTYNDWETDYGGSTSSVESDPLMVNPGLGDFHLQAGSPCRNVGTDVELSRDFDNVPVPQETNPAVGAFEPNL